MRRVLFLPLLLAQDVALADWYINGAAFQCAAEKRQLTLVATLDSSNDWERVHAPNGFTAFKDGQSIVWCSIGAVHLKVDVTVYPPAERGFCAGTGSVSVRVSEKKSNRLLFSQADFGGWCYQDQIALSKLVISGKTKSSNVTVCEVPYAADSQPITHQCKTTQIGR